MIAPSVTAAAAAAAAAYPPQPSTQPITAYVIYSSFQPKGSKFPTPAAVIQRLDASWTNTTAPFVSSDPFVRPRTPPIFRHSKPQFPGSWGTFSDQVWPSLQNPYHIANGMHTDEGVRSSCNESRQMGRAR